MRALAFDVADYFAGKRAVYMGFVCETAVLLRSFDAVARPYYQVMPLNLEWGF